MRISDVPELKEISNKLASLGYDGPRGLTKLIGAARVAAKPMADYLGMSEQALADLINANIQYAGLASDAEAQRLDNLTCRLGAAVERAPLLTRTGDVVKSVVVATPVASIAVAANLPAAIDHVAQMPPVRDQGDRGTCVAHACVAAYEHRLGLASSPPADLSEQFLYWRCKETDGARDEEGTWIAVGMPLIERDGVCDETGWPYNPRVAVPPNEGQGPAPTAATDAARARRTRTRNIAKNGVAEYKEALVQDHCVAFSIPVFDSWYKSQEVRRTGELTLPLPAEISVGGHAMCIVGYADDASPQYPGGGYFILRNSWSTQWATASSSGAGYGRIPYAYVARFGMEAWVVD